MAQGPGAPLEDVARRGGGGDRDVYRRFPDREALLRAVALDVLARVLRGRNWRSQAGADAFRALARYMHRAIDLRVGAIMPVLMGQLSLEDEALIPARDDAARCGGRSSTRRTRTARCGRMWPLATSGC
ncbi:MAG: hypothetical protein U0232_02785 [Thermomicrobiales bacterium]